MTPRVAALAVGAAAAMALLAAPFPRSLGLAALAVAAGVAAGRIWTWRWAWTAPVFVVAAGVDAPLGLPGSLLAATGLAAAAWVPPRWRAPAMPLLVAPALLLSATGLPASLGMAGACLAAALVAALARSALTRIPPRPTILRTGVKATVMAPAILLIVAMLAIPHLAPTGLDSIRLALAIAAAAVLASFQGMAMLASVRSADAKTQAWMAGALGGVVLTGLTLVIPSLPTRPTLALATLAMAPACALVAAWMSLGGPLLRIAVGAIGSAGLGLALQTFTRV